MAYLWRGAAQRTTHSNNPAAALEKDLGADCFVSKKKTCMNDTLHTWGLLLLEKGAAAATSNLKRVDLQRGHPSCTHTKLTDSSQKTSLSLSSVFFQAPASERDG
jgi:hypothetical protein